uniref:Uncharacterized protein n=1 Tax=Arundo donax TaxID=35708 RepID=A0A0A9B670_ARUDO
MKGKSIPCVPSYLKHLEDWVSLLINGGLKRQEITIMMISIFASLLALLMLIGSYKEE